MRALPTSAIAMPLLTAALVGHVTSANADTLFGIEYSGTTYSIDATTGVGGAPVATGFAQTNSMARGPGGTFYTATDTRLLTLDANTGAATAGPTLTLGAQAVAITGMTFLGTTLYAVNHTLSNAPVPTAADFLWSIDPTTGSGGANVALDVTGLQALASANGVLYGWHPTLGLVTVDPASGAVTDPFASTGAGGIEIQTLAFDSGGNLYGAHSALYRVSLADGTLQFVGQGGYGNLRGMEFVGVASVPEPSTWMLLGLGFGLMGWIGRRRRAS